MRQYLYPVFYSDYSVDGVWRKRWWLFVDSMSSGDDVIYFITFYWCDLSCRTDGGPPWHDGGAYGLWGSCRFRFLGIQRRGDY